MLQDDNLIVKPAELHIFKHVLTYCRFFIGLRDEDHEINIFLHNLAALKFDQEPIGEFAAFLGVKIQHGYSFI